MVVHGPAEVMRSYLGRTPHHAVSVVVASVLVVVLAVVVTVVGARQRNRFAAGLGALGLVGTLATILAVTRVVGPVFGYLVVWAVALPFGVLIGAGMLRLPATGATPAPGAFAASGFLRPVLCAVGLVAGVLLVVRVAAIPPLQAAGDSQVGRLDASPPRSSTTRGGRSSGTTARARGGRLLDVERFVGLVNRLDQSGYHPTVNHFGKARSVRATSPPEGRTARSNWGPGARRRWPSRATSAAGRHGRDGDRRVAGLPGGRALAPPGQRLLDEEPAGDGDGEDHGEARQLGGPKGPVGPVAARGDGQVDGEVQEVDRKTGRR